MEVSQILKEEITQQASTAVYGLDSLHIRLTMSANGVLTSDILKPKVQPIQEMDTITFYTFKTIFILFTTIEIYPFLLKTLFSLKSSLAYYLHHCLLMQLLALILFILFNCILKCYF